MGTMNFAIKCTVTALASSVWFSLPARSQTAVLDDLFAQLKTADAAQAIQISQQIQEEWSKSGSASIDMLNRMGQMALAEGDYPAAIDHFSAAIDHAPEFAEAYNGRATAFYLMGQIGPSIEDIRVTLALNPRHFGAMIGFASILEEIDRSEDALEVYQRIHDLVPADENVHDAIDRLQLLLGGQTL